MKKLLRLWVMTHIKYDKDYVKNSAKSAGADIEKLNHNQIAAYKTALKSIEADYMIESAFKSKIMEMKDVDISVFKKI